VPTPSRPADPAQPVSEFTIHLSLGASDDSPLHDQDEVEGPAGHACAPTEALPQEPSRAIPHDRSSDLATHRHAQPVGGAAIRQGDEKKVRPVQPSTPTEDALELRAPPQALVRREAQPGHGPIPRRQADSRLRPFCRRLFRTSRPLLVRMRTRKPCVRFRRRLFG
jgi:hypothetical protein